MIDTTAKALTDFQRDARTHFASFSGYGHRGSLCINGQGVFFVLENDELRYEGNDAQAALDAYNDVHTRHENDRAKAKAEVGQ